MMRSSFLLTVSSFLTECSVEHILSDSFIKVINSELIIRVRWLGMAKDEVESREFVSDDGKKLKIINLYEDLWYTKGDIVKNRLLALMGKGDVIFARKCVVVPLSAQASDEFLNNNHLLGAAKCKYRYGLVYNRQIVAVTAFSASRPMKRGEAMVDSYEWVRYANLGSLRVAGGMGKVMNHFVKEERVQEIMSYADIDWGDGDVYRKLGFTLAGETPPIEFYVNRDTFERISLKKLRNDRKFKSIPESDMVLVLNSGNLKFLRLFSLL
ncbi:MAG: hypothetical protein AB9922_12825 [Bacteroidales bacterium]